MNWFHFIYQSIYQSILCSYAGTPPHTHTFFLPLPLLHTYTHTLFPSVFMCPEGITLVWINTNNKELLGKITFFEKKPRSGWKINSLKKYKKTLFPSPQFLIDWQFVYKRFVVEVMTFVWVIKSRWPHIYIYIYT